MKPTISSLKFAQDFGICHSDLMKKIRNFNCSEDFTKRNFLLSTYKDSTGRTLDYFEITQQGFTFLISHTEWRINDQCIEIYTRVFEEMAQKISYEEQSLYTLLNKATLEYMLVDQGASNAGRNLQYLGKVAKPLLRKSILKIMDQLQLKLPFNDEGE
ncbi:Rha family transcriptional regulator [Acinetobacter sp. SwsAc6]|uniref:Rha family transcriptional regulator n=1 Tax=Acinetobacter TaxID=469 RepID=UPI000D11565E|nr:MULTISPECIES: Rha family transcriptional regulator [Acinetobacter]NWK75815.1 Rha family transcriptional regulator [Acinetobacter sp. SwsAc6]QCO20029.1 hypothetical protein C9E88_000065 [Acinetobacter cumulans]